MKNAASLRTKPNGVPGRRCDTKQLGTNEQVRVPALDGVAPGEPRKDVVEDDGHVPWFGVMEKRSDVIIIICCRMDVGLEYPPAQLGNE